MVGGVVLVVDRDDVKDISLVQTSDVIVFFVNIIKSKRGRRQIRLHENLFDGYALKYS